MSDNTKLAIIFFTFFAVVSIFGVIIDYDQYEREIIKVESRGITCECPRYAASGFIRNPEKFLEQSDTTFFSKKEYAKVSVNYIVKIPK